jgi:isopentenyl diphosphate isomerase/L-lactate dehydrogenase-like FMN-dependent dehydrogenase
VNPVHLIVYQVTVTRPPFVTIDEAYRKARRRLPAPLYNRVETGFPTQFANVRAFDEVFFTPRAATVYEERELRTSVLGTEIDFPVILACPGGSRLIHPDGEKAAAAAAARAGTIDAVAMATGHPLEEVAAAAPDGVLWQQLYMSRGREGAEELIERAAAAGYRALVVTVDMPITPFPVHDGTRDRGAELSLYNAVRFGPEVALRPRWLLNFVKDTRAQQGMTPAERLPVVVGTSPACLHRGALTNKLSATWDDFEWIRKAWTGPIVVKGVLNGRDARRAIDAGASAIVVSNHGGTALQVSPTLRVLPEVVAAVGGECEVLLDGGVRSGAQVVKALALGARAVLVGRCYLMGLAVAGEAGVLTVLQILRSEIDQTLGALGCPSVHALDETYVQIPPGWPTSSPGRPGGADGA